MKYIALFFTLLLSSCAPYASQTGPLRLDIVQASPTAGAVSLVAQQPQATQEPSESPTPVPSYSATPDYEGTKIAAGATADNVALLIAQADANKAKADLDRENAVSTRAANSLTAAAVHDSDLGTQVSIQATQARDSQIFEARKPTIIVAMTQAGYTAQRESSEIAFYWGTGIAFVLLSLALLIGIVRLVPAREAQAQAAAQQAPPQPPVSETPDRFEHYEQTRGPYPGEMQLQGIPATRTQLGRVAMIVVKGENPSVRNCTPLSEDGSGFARTGFNGFASWMVRNGYAEDILANSLYRGIKVTAKGRAFLKPYEGLVPESEPDTSPSDHDLIPA